MIFSIPSVFQIYRWPLIYVGFLALAFQIQITLGRDSGSLGLTLNLADLTLPICGIIVLYSLFQKKTHWPNWTRKGTDFFVLALSFYFLFSAYHAYTLTGILSPWALVNRLLGWGVLMAYFYAGSWLATNFGSRLFTPFILCFSAFSLFSSLVMGIGITLDEMDIFSSFMPDYPLSGFMGNRNAAAFIFLSAFVSVSILALKSPSSISKKLVSLFCFITPAFFFLNGSRTIIILLPLVFLTLFFFFKKTGLRLMLVPLVCGLLVFLGMTKQTEKSLLREHQSERISLETITTQEVKKLHGSDTVRTLVNNDAIELFLERPVFGIGLGNFLERQKEKYGKLIDLIDSVPLWFLTEMGIAGLTLFLAFGTWLFLGILQREDFKGLPSPPAQIYRYIMMSIILIFCVMGLVHQLFYARFFWFMLGLASVQAPDISLLFPSDQKTRIL